MSHTPLAAWCLRPGRWLIRALRALDGAAFTLVHEAMFTWPPAASGRRAGELVFQEYTVEWVTQVDATGPLEAARAAVDRWRGLERIATFVTVYGPDGDRTAVDLLDAHLTDPREVPTRRPSHSADPRGRRMRTSATRRHRADHGHGTTKGQDSMTTTRTSLSAPPTAAHPTPARLRRRLVWCGRARADQLSDLTTRMLAHRPTYADAPDHSGRP